LTNPLQVCPAKIDVQSVFPSQPIHLEADYGTNFLFADGHVEMVEPRYSQMNDLNLQIK
jgi:prepilin-type processing-associated H-X9-DG protein